MGSGCLGIFESELYKILSICYVVKGQDRSWQIFACPSEVDDESLMRLVEHSIGVHNPGIGCHQCIALLEPRVVFTQHETQDGGPYRIGAYALSSDNRTGHT